MSRIGKLPVEIPSGVTVTVKEGIVTVKGPKGQLSKIFDVNTVTITVEGNTLSVDPVKTSRFAAAMHGTARSIIDAMVKGVVNPFSKNLEIQGVGFRAQVKGNILNLNLGYSHDINFLIPEGIIITVIDNTKLKVEGIDKQLVGQVAAQIKHYYPVEPYKGKGVRILGEYVRRKEGKKSA